MPTPRLPWWLVLSLFLVAPFAVGQRGEVGGFDLPIAYLLVGVAAMLGALMTALWWWHRSSGAET